MIKLTPTHTFYLAAEKLLQEQGFTFHTASKETHDSSIMTELHGKHWYCWCGPEGRWDVESGPTRDTEEEAVTDALAAYVAFSNGIRETIIAQAPTEDPDRDDYDDDEDGDVKYYDDRTMFEVARICREGGGTTRHHINPSITDPKGIVIDAIDVAYAALDKVSNEVAYGDGYAAPALDKLANAREAIRMVNL